MGKRKSQIGEDTKVEEESSSKKNVVWTTEMDCCLTDALVEQTQRGNKINKCFTTIAYLAACDEMYVKFGKKVSVIHLKNRLKTLKKDFAAYHDMENSSSGFSFNRITRLMDAEPNVWDMYIKEHPEARSFRYKPVPCYENLRILFGEDRATSRGFESAKQKRLCKEKEQDEMNGSNHEPREDTEIEIHVESGGESMNTSGMSKQVPNGPLSKLLPQMTSRRKLGSIDDLKEEFSMLKSGMDAVASAIVRCAPRIITEEKLFEEVRKIEGLDVDFQLLAYDYLCQDITRGRTFIGLPIDYRRRWLELKLDRRAG